MAEEIFDFSDEQIQDLAAEAGKVKAKHKVGKVFLIEVEGEDDEERVYRAWLKKPSLKTMSAFFTLGQNDPVQACKLVFNDCKLEGDNEIVTDEEVFAGAMSQIEDLMKTRRARLAKF